MVTMTKFNCFVKDLAEKKHDLSSDALYVMLTLTAPVITNSVKTDLVEIASGNGYTTGGNAATLITSSQTSGVYCLVLNDPATWTATPSAIANFQYAVLYNSAGTKPLIGFWTYPGGVVTVNPGETFKCDLSQVAGVGVLTLT